MADLPIQLSIQSSLANDKRESVTCTALIRSIPGNRVVYEANWNGNAVIAKIFFHKLKAKRHLKREWKGLNLLQERQLSSITPLFHGRSDDGRWGVVVEKIFDSETALAVFNRMEGKAERLNLLVRIGKEIAEHHKKGVLQNDLHLGNFLISGKDIFALDPGQMRFFSKPISRKSSLLQLAILACYLPEDDINSAKSLYNEYFNLRGWRFQKKDERFLRKERILYKKNAVHKGLKKVLRTSTRHQRVKIGNCIAVLDRLFLSSAELIDFFEQIDVLMDSGKVLKNGNTCYVSRVVWNNKDMVVKRYNHRSIIHSLRHTIKRSRARQGWLHGHRLRMLTIGTPKPLAYIEQRRGPLLWKSYLVTEFAEGQSLQKFLSESSAAEAYRAEVIQKVTGLIRKLERYQISHGDLKHSNILINREPVLTDLDGMRVTRWNWLYRQRQAKDIRRFNKGFERKP